MFERERERERVCSSVVNRKRVFTRKFCFALLFVTITYYFTPRLSIV